MRMFNGPLVAAGAVGASMYLIASAAEAKAPPASPPPPPPAPATAGPNNFQCGRGQGSHIFLDDGKDVTATTAEYPKASDADNVDLTFNTGANVADGFANIKPAGTALLTDITFNFTDPSDPVTGFLFRGQLNDNTDPIVVTVTDQHGAMQVFDYFVTGKKGPFDIGALGFSQLING